MDSIPLPILAVHLQFQAIDPVLPPQAIGAMWRGALGKALQEHDPKLYATYFEPKAKGRLLRRYEDAPTPFALEASLPDDLIAQPGDPINLWVKSFGQIDPAPILNGLIKAAANGLGRGRGAAELFQCVPTSAPDDIEGGMMSATIEPPIMPDAVHIALTTPLRIRTGGDAMQAAAFSVTEWIKALQRRLELLTALYGDAGFSPLPVPEIGVAQAQLWQVPMHRWSARQKREIDMSGIMGTFYLPLKGLEPLWPAIWTGQWTQVGAATNAGLGCYRVVTA